MKKLHTIFKDTNWLGVWNRFLSHYPTETDNEQYYYKLYSKLRKTVPLGNTTKLIIDEKISRLNSVKLVTVLGILSNNEIDYALEFNPWEEWLGMEVESATLAQYSGTDIVAHCLFEMVYAGNGKYDKPLLGRYSFASI